MLGFFNVVYILGIHSGSKSRWNGAAIAGLLLAIVSSVAYLVFSLLTFRKVHMVRARDAMHRRHSDGESIHLLPEDEMQRQQLLRLLLQRENGVRPSPEASQSTFRIDLPDSIRRAETHLTAPQNIYESRDSRSRSVPPVDSYLNMSGPRSTTTPAEPPQTSLDPGLDRNFSQSSRSPPYTAGDLGIPGIINTRYPDEKEQETAHLHGEIHPLEREVLRARPQYQIVDTPREVLRIDGKQGLKGARDEDRPRSASRESRRAEIELERSKKGDAKRAELEGIKISPRIQRVETDGWSRR